MSDQENANPVKVTVHNWPDRKRRVNKTTVKTWIIDPAGAAGPKNVPIADYEPSRVRLTIRPVDAAIAVTLDTPVTSPDVSTASSAPQGAYIPPLATGMPEEFLGPDAMWVNSLGTVTRVVVKKEYC